MKHFIGLLFVLSVVNLLFVNRGVWWAWVLTLGLAYLSFG